MYIAYYHWTPTLSLPVKYHISLLMTPKNPNMMSKESWHYHVVDHLAMDNSSEGVWIFEARKSYSQLTRHRCPTAWEGTSLGIR